MAIGLPDVLQRLRGAKKSGGGYMAKCPAHDDKTASLSITEGKAGRVLFHCHAGCDTQNIACALGLSMSDLMGEQKPQYSGAVEVERYSYGQFEKVRKSDKSFYWTPKLNGADPGLYNAAALNTSDYVFVVEGEKDVETLKRCGLPSVCSAWGAGNGNKWRREYNALFTGKRVYICPDNDDIGYQFAALMRDNIASTAASVCILDLLAVYPQLQAHGDISDIYVALGKEATLDLLKKAQKLPPPGRTESGGSSGSSDNQYNNYTTQTANNQAKPIIISATDVKSAPVPWLIENFIARRGISSVQGLPDSGKTFFTLNLVATIAMGGAFPDDAGEMVHIPKGRVLYANFDDSLEYTVKPRLESMGVTDEAFKNISLIPAESGLTFQDPRLKEVFEQVKPDLAIFDTLQHFIGVNVDLNRANETNAALINLKNLCEQYNTAAVVVQHISKQGSNGTGGASVCWGIGSMAINGLFRSVWTLGKVTKEDAPPYRRALAPTKTNLLPCIPPARLYDLDPQYGFMWAGVDSEITAQDLRSGDKKAAHRPDTERREAADFLQSILSRGEVESAELERRATDAGISRATYKRARENLGVVSVKRSNKWYSGLPDKSKSIKSSIDSSYDTLALTDSRKPCNHAVFGNSREQTQLNTYDTLDSFDTLAEFTELTAEEIDDLPF